MRMRATILLFRGIYKKFNELIKGPGSCCDGLQIRRQPEDLLLPSKTMKFILVYCGSSNGVSDVFNDAARDLGYLIAESGLGLVYGGGCTGLMGRIANAVLEKGGQVIGYMPKAMIDKEVAHFGLTKLHIVEDMHERKAKMMNHADAIIALPGGIGTMEEWFEAITWFQLNYHSKPVGLLNVNGFYEPLVEQLRVMKKEGFIREDWHKELLIETDAGKLLGLLISEG